MSTEQEATCRYCGAVLSLARIADLEDELVCEACAVKLEHGEIAR